MQRSVAETEKAVRMVNELSLFGTNEDVDEIATTDLRFQLKQWRREGLRRPWANVHLTTAPCP